MLKNLLLALIGFFLSLQLILPVQAKETKTKVVIHLFSAKGCPHCAKEKVFLDQLEQKYPRLEIKDYEITQNPENLTLLRKVGTALKADVSGVPFTAIGEKYFIGYYNDEITGQEIEIELKRVLANGYKEVINNLENENKENKAIKPDISNSIKTIILPFFGKIETKTLSLPVLTFVIALLDGFNPCAMWTLLFLISLLLGMKDKKRIWILGTAFIVASALVYFLFMSAWLNLFLFLGFVIWVRWIIGFIALGSGSYYLKEYITNKDNECKVTGTEKRQKVFTQLKAITQKKQFWLALGGIILLAFVVNLVELICSAGLPAIYTQILSLADLPRWQYYLYLLFYIFIFMLDDLFIFFTAMLTLQAVGIQGKYARYSHLVGGILMLIIGLLMLFKPEWLMFG